MGTGRHLRPASALQPLQQRLRHHLAVAQLSFTAALSLWAPWRPNSRSVSQPSKPDAASGRAAEVRVGTGLPTVLEGAGAPAGGVACEAACIRLEKKPRPCEFGRPVSGTP